MEDPRLRKLAEMLINYCTELQRGENILIEISGKAEPLGKALVEEAYKAGGNPFVTMRHDLIQKALLMKLEEKHARTMARHDLALMKDMDAYIGVRATLNKSELKDVPSSGMAVFQKYYLEPVHSRERVNNTRWVVLRYPSGSMAQLAKMGTEEFENFFFDACLVDYRKMEDDLKPLVEIMQKTDKVLIKGPGTELTFSIKDIPVVPCFGKINVPDGEVFTAPIRDSVNGILTYNTPSAYQGFIHENISFEFSNGKIVKATSNNSTRLNEILDTDEGSRYIGEFALGVNPRILHPMTDTLFDEKIAGSFHLTPGNCYEEAPNGNRSAIHWDLVSIQRNDYGGGDIYFDDVLVRKDGSFVMDELQNLNPENW